MGSGGDIDPSATLVGMTAPATGMWPGFVARTATHAPPALFADELVEGWLVVVGGPIPGGVLLAALAQILLESGTRQIDRDHDGDVDADDQVDGCWNGNCGNIRGTYTIDDTACWTSFRAGEGYGANQIFLEPGPGNKFRSYIGQRENPHDPVVQRRAIRRGVRDFLSLLTRKYARAIERAAIHDYAGYVHELHSGGYFTASETAYYKTEDALRRTVEQLPQVAAFLKETA